MIRVILTVLLTFFLLTSASCVFANDAACAPEVAKHAENIAATLKNWDDVYLAYEKYRSCDDGSIAEGFSDSIGEILASNWASIITLGRLTKLDENFKIFVLHHVDETLSRATLHKIKENAHNRCPMRLIDLCGEIANSADH